MPTYTYGGTYTIDVKTDWVSSNSANFQDFNRIEANIATAKSYLTSISYTFSAATSVTNRTITYIDYISSINRIENNLDDLRANFLTPPGYGAKDTWVAKKVFDYNALNRLELNIKLLMDYGALVFNSFKYCGATICGDTGGLY